MPDIEDMFRYMERLFRNIQLMCYCIECMFRYIGWVFKCIELIWGGKKKPR